MADEEITEEKVIEETPAEEAKQEELPLAATSEETPQEDKPVEAAAEPEPVKEEPKPDWKEKELKAKHRQNQELKRALAEKDAEIAARDALLAKFNQGKTETPVVPVDEVEKKVQERLAAVRYNEQASKVQQDGEKLYGESFKEAVSNLEILGGFDMPTMNGLLATDDPAKVIHELGKNPEKYRQLMEVPFERRIIEMGKIAMAPASKPVSEAPAPVKPVGGRAAPAKETIRDDMDDDQWYSIRTAQKRAKWNASQVRR